MVGSYLVKFMDSSIAYLLNPQKDIDLVPIRAFNCYRVTKTWSLELLIYLVN